MFGFIYVSKMVNGKRNEMGELAGWKTHGLCTGETPGSKLATESNLAETVTK